MDMYAEFNSAVASELGLKEFKSRKVTKSYCFNLPDIPAQSDYLEVRYSVSNIHINTNYFLHFNTNITFLNNKCNTYVTVFLL